MKTSVSALLCFIVVVSCTKISDNPERTFLTGKGVFILNEGNFMAGNGSLSYYSYDSAKIYNDLFPGINGRPLGDIPNSMIMKGDKAYIVVNNSGKIEVINLFSLESETTISGLISPRNISFVKNNKAYVTSLYSDSVTIINTENNSISGYINLRRSSESILVSGTYAYISNWFGGNEVMIINTTNDKVVDSIQVSNEPESMVIDKNKTLWVLCNGGWQRDNFAELIGINTSTNQIQNILTFSTKQASPTSLQIDGNGETLYYLEKGVRKMSISSTALPSAVFIPESDNHFYKLGINPANNDVFITDALDYAQKGYVLYYQNNGTPVSKFKVDIIPGFMCFKQN